MCGIIGIATTAHTHPSVDEQRFCAMRDAMTHRGPDDAGYWADEHVMLGHRRLSVIDTSAHGHQPMHTGDRPQRFTLVYNGEIYNDQDVRAALGAQGVRFRSSCDTETVLEAFAMWGEEAFTRLRGMFACAVYDHAERTLTLARDPLGIKPLYYAFTGTEFVFASEAHVVASHPAVSARPDWAMVSAYTTTIRTVLGERTLYQGVRAVRAGQVLRCTVSGDRPEITLRTWWESPAPRDHAEPEQCVDEVRQSLQDAIRCHLRADVPVCALLSGGLDSTIIVGEARAHHDGLRTYAAGEDAGPEGDLAHAHRVADEFGTHHAEAIVDEALFRFSWERMVAQQGMPLSTPNEVAIHAVASRLRADGCVVTLSGEGADELFGGYAQPLEAVVGYLSGAIEAPTPGAFELNANAWAPLDAKGQLFTRDAWEGVERDAWVRSFYDEEFEACLTKSGVRTTDDLGTRLQPHLRFLRRVNLTGLLQRLDSASMLASVEGRTPFADAAVARCAEALPASMKYDHTGTPPACTKRVLREAFATAVPDHVMHRDKASFPLPFTRWMGGHEGIVRESALLHRLYQPGVIELIATRPGQMWNIAWPAINLAYWGRGLDSV